MKMNNEILLRRKNMLEINVSENILSLDNEDNIAEQAKRNASIASICKNISAYGYLLSKEIVEKLQNTDYSEIVNWYLEVRDVIKDIVGVREHMEPLYKNFPEDVMNTTEGEMYVASLTYFLSNGTISPEEEKARPELSEFVNLTVINEADKDTYNTILTNLLSSKVSLGTVDKQDISYFVKNNENFYDLLPESIPNKENLIYLTKTVIDLFGYEDNRTLALTSVYKTATDVLRLATALSDGDISLSSKVKYRHFKKNERRFLLELLDNCKYPLEDMYRYKNNWIILGEILHPGDYAKRYVNAYDNFSKLRGNVKIQKFNGKVDKAIETKNLSTLLKLLSSRPGEFCKKIDRCLSNFEKEEEQNIILDSFEKIANKVESTVIIGLMQHMKDRKDLSDTRIFFPKGKISKAYFKDNDLKDINISIIDRTIDICEKALVSIYAEKEYMGNVYIDETMKDYMFPMVLRNTARALKPMARGSKINLKDNCNVARIFMYWKEPENLSHVDLDLSVVLLDKDYKLIDTCYYGNYDRPNIKNYGCYHSGDVRQAPEGASEYIDLDLDKLNQKDVAYVLACVHSFTHEPFYDLAEAFVGVMDREKPQDGAIYEPSTVVTKSDLITEQETSLSMMLSVADRTVTWLDLGADVHHVDGVVNNINSNKGNIIPMTKAFMQKNLVSVYDVVMLNALARGCIVTEKADADYIFSLEGYIEPEIIEEEIVEETPIEEIQEDVDETKETIEDEVEVSEEVVEIPKRILITPYDIDTLIGNYL